MASGVQGHAPIMDLEMAQVSVISFSLGDIIDANGVVLLADGKTFNN